MHPLGTLYHCTIEKIGVFRPLHPLGPRGPKYPYFLYCTVVQGPQGVKMAILGSLRFWFS